TPACGTSLCPPRPGWQRGTPTQPAPRAGSEPAAQGRERGALLAALLAGVQAHAEVGVHAEQRGARAEGQRGVAIVIAASRHRVVQAGALRTRESLGRAVLELAVQGEAGVGCQPRMDGVAGLPA